MRGKFAGVALAIVLMGCSAVGQSTFGSIVGTVRDTTQAVVPGARVKIRSLEGIVATLGDTPQPVGPEARVKIGSLKNNSVPSPTADENGSLKFVTSSP